MEFLQGQTLRERLAKPLTPGSSDVVGAGEGTRGAALRIDTLLDLAIQIADGLDAAHAQGIIHAIPSRRTSL